MISISKENLQYICIHCLENFPCSKVYFAEKLGNRVSFIIGQGEESYLPKQKINITENLIFFYYGTILIKPEILKKFILEEIKKCD